MNDDLRLKCIYITLVNLQLIKYNKWEMIDSIGYESLQNIIKTHIDALDTCSRIISLDQQTCNALVDDLLQFQSNFR